MESRLFLRQWSRHRMEANGLGIILFRYADWLEKRGYSRNTIHPYTQAVENFGFWRENRSRLSDFFLLGSGFAAAFEKRL